MRILALDVGTSSVKAAVLDRQLAQPVAEVAKASYAIDYPSPDAAEVPAERIWDALNDAARHAVRLGGPVEWVGLSCLMPALVLLDAAGQPLGPIWIHLDRRSRPIARRVLSEVGDEFLATVGNRPLPGGISAISYRQRCEVDPRLPSQVRQYLHLNGWLGLRLTGRACFDPANASFTGLFGTVTDQRWSSRWCAYFGVEQGWLPEVVCGSTVLGGLRAEVAAAWGLPADLPVKLGTADTSSAMLAAGLKPGDMLHSVGTTQVLGVLTNTPRPDPRRLTRRSGVGDGHCYVTHNPVGGVALDWVRKLCYSDQSKSDFFDRTVREAAKRTSEIKLDPPFLGGDRLNIEPQFAALCGLSLATDREDVLIAVLDGMRRGHRLAIAGLGEAGPAPGGRIVLTGGGAEIVQAILPEYANANIQVIDEASLRGVAYL